MKPIRNLLFIILLSLSFVAAADDCGDLSSKIPRNVPKPLKITSQEIAALEGLESYTRGAHRGTAKFEAMTLKEKVMAFYTQAVLSLRNYDGMKSADYWIELDGKLAKSERDFFKSSGSLEGMRSTLTTQTRPSDLSQVFSEIGLIPLEPLADPRLGVSGSGLMKSSVHQEVDHFLDFYFGIDHTRVNQKMHKAEREVSTLEKSGHETYSGLHPAMLYTSYMDFAAILRIIKPKAGQTVVDLGAGIGRLGLMLGFDRPNVKFIGYEFLSPRLEEGQRAAEAFGFQNVQFVKKDLSIPIGQVDSDIAKADYYFMYDPFSDSDFQIIMEKLRQNSLEKPFVIVAIEGNGKLLKDLNARPWLQQVRLTSEQVRFKFSLYRSIKP